ncbi:MAG: bifunctional glutamate N-acetyltransferase/amino-acid acetyltransferase ArgJ [Acidobacteria bacterium]|nr:bifunctional glutamate N-acetyltransferase/amino-acid acetyltransferase ArgJ [Acidobacteriota bacterium]
MNLPLGYRYSSLYAGIRKAAKDDLSLIVSDVPASAAGVFTQNKAMAAPVILSKKNLAATKGVASAILTNAGNANCATRTGMKVALETTRAVAKVLRVPASKVLVCSTGVIGVELDGSKITSKARALADGLAADRFEDVVGAIMTTDLAPKKAHAAISVKGGAVHIAGTTKGSGMIQPLMATTLGYVMTDAALSPSELRGMLKRASARSYNAMSVDGDTSTNDTLFLLANGASGLKMTAKDKGIFEQALTVLLEDLARQIARDGEGAKKLVTIDVTGTKTDDEAMRIARQIGNSPLVKTAIAGSDPNWGRVIMAAGNAGVDFELRNVSITMQGMLVCKNGLAVDFSEEELTARLDEPDTHVTFAVKGGGNGSARFYTCDFTEGYIKINGSYRT